MEKSYEESALVGILPPGIKGEVEAFFDIIILKPAWNFQFSSEFSFLVVVHLWGNESPIKRRFPQHEDKIRLSFRVCCNEPSFRNYLTDSKYIKISLIYQNLNDTPRSKGKVHGKLWSDGDIIGQIVLKDIKLNQRGEFFEECDILNGYGDLRGSTTILLLHSTMESHMISTKSLQDERDCSLNDLDLGNLSFSKDHSLFDPNQKDHANYDDKIQYTNKIQSISENIQESQTLDKTNDSLLEKLFKLADTGLISPSDIPMLIQIHDGRSPSLDILNFPLHQKTESNDNETLKIASDIPSNANNQEECLKDMENIKSLKNPAQENVECHPANEVVEIELFYLVLPTFESKNEIQMTVEEQNKGNYVKQRSRTCFIVSMFVTNKNDDKISTEVIFVSRQMNQAVVKFGDKKMMSVSKIQLLEDIANCSLNVRITCRRLGERLGIDLTRTKLNFEELCKSQNKVLHGFPFPMTDNTSYIDSKSGHFSFKIKCLKEGCPSFEFTEENNSIVPLKLGNPEYLPCEVRVTHGSSQVENFSSDKQQNEISSITKVESFVATCHEDTSHAEQKLQDFKEYESNSSILSNQIERTEEYFRDLLLKLRIIKAKSLPFVKLISNNGLYYPNSYVKCNGGDQVIQTKVVKGSSMPVWDEEFQIQLTSSQLQKTRSHLILKIHHNKNLKTDRKNDPLIGFVSINLQLLNSSEKGNLIAWFPILDLKGEVCGQIKVGITQKKCVSNQCTSKIKLKSPTKHVKTTRCLFPSNSKTQDLDSPERLPTNILSRERKYIQQSNTLYSNPVKSDPIKTPLKCKQKEYVSSCTQTSILNTKPSNSAQYDIENFTWMNQLKMIETPCASFMDLSNVEPPKCNKKRKSRIAANINLL